MGVGGGWGGRMELPEVRVPCPALSTCHCMQPVGDPAVRNRGSPRPVPTFPSLPSSLSHSAKKTQGGSVCPLDPRTVGLCPASEPPPRPMSGAPKAKDLGSVGPAALLALLWPRREWPLGPILRERLSSRVKEF